MSSIIPAAERIGYEAAVLLDQLMKGRQPEESHLEIEPLGIAERLSTDVMAIDDEDVAAAIQMIRLRACEGLTVSEILDEVPIARSSLERRFRQYLGRSPQAEIRRVQIKRACQLLRDTDLSLVKISQLTGFKHSEYFSVVFKREGRSNAGQVPRLESRACPTTIWTFHMKVMVLTGAGISAESGIPTFRGADGLWEGHRFEDVATPHAFERDPTLVHRFYNMRRQTLLSESIQPNAAHIALAEFEAQHRDEFFLVTQNIDDLHQRAGSKNVLPMHGELLKVRCTESGDVFSWNDDLSTETVHPNRPDLVGTLRPHIVWFGEMPFGLEAIDQFAQRCDVFIAIGTSAVVYPAAGIVQATSRDCRRIEINLDDTPQSVSFDTTIRGKASVEVPKFLASISD